MFKRFKKSAIGDALLECLNIKEIIEDDGFLGLLTLPARLLLFLVALLFLPFFLLNEWSKTWFGGHSDES